MQAVLILIYGVMLKALPVVEEILARFRRAFLLLLLFFNALEHLVLKLVTFSSIAVVALLLIFL